jgi:hypothetical protein
MGRVLPAERIALALWHPQFRVVDGFHFDGAWFDVSNSAITCHVFSPFFSLFAATMPRRVIPSMQYSSLWGRLATCGRLSIGLPEAPIAPKEVPHPKRRYAHGILIHCQGP